MCVKAAQKYVGEIDPRFSLIVFQAIEWYAMRKRNRMRDKRTNSFYQWPSQSI
jgi:hypothetical protein